MLFGFSTWSTDAVYFQRIFVPLWPPWAIGTTVWVGVGGVTPGKFWKSTYKIVHFPAFREHLSRFFILKGCQCYLTVWGLLAQVYFQRIFVPLWPPWFFILKGCQCYLTVWGLLAEVWVGVGGVIPGQFWRSICKIVHSSMLWVHFDLLIAFFYIEKLK